jgi:hypothetical protein
MAQTISPEAIEKGTGKSWSDWINFFESINASEMSHKEMAEAASDLGGAPIWWRQMVTVAYEQHIGRRVVGQDCEGNFNVASGKTFAGTMDEALEAWVGLVGGCQDFSGVVIAREPDISSTENWRYWRCGLADGSRVNVNIYQKLPGKASLGIEHQKIEFPEQVEHWRAFWKSFLGDLQ